MRRVFLDLETKHLFVVVTGLFEVANRYPDMIDALSFTLSRAKQRMSRIPGLTTLDKQDRQSFNRCGSNRDLTNVLNQQLSLPQELLSIVKRSDTQDYSLNAGCF